MKKISESLGFVALELVLLVVLVGLVSGAGYLVVKNKNDAEKTYDQANASAANTVSPKLSKKDQTKTQPTADTGTAQNQNDQQTPAPEPAQKPVAIVHPSNNNCDNKEFTAYVSNTSGTHAYYQADTSSQVFKDYSYKSSVSISCNSYSPAGWGLTTNYWVPFRDLSVNPL